ncbi:Phosphatidylinositol 4,5-bisphosphate 3-kinase catalytic subunit alpha isoform [Thelohanellus kitauei]|uniref:Phosphatidylinositol 4,5-bisphosphate 3-kinase catalytic subunit alpha isoform n=1 Tax=Thelohanellus kitauei TaxID=669202 RepID=A0A0C2MX33_THEKT|nr:Phosphatidylinositol 4,5-bisphosphate 3-kinase catalytic subunit alpha isoform [Thelohanellus kitauei]
MAETESIPTACKYQILNGQVEVICLIPEYGAIELTLNQFTTISELRKAVSKHIMDNNEEEITFENYQIVYVSENTCHQEINEDTITLAAIDCFIPVFRFVNRDLQSSPKRKLQSLISVFGVNLDKACSFYKDIHSQRLKLANFAYDERESDDTHTFKQKFIRKFPPKITKVDSFSTHHQSIIANRVSLNLKVFYQEKTGNYIFVNLQVPVGVTIGNLKQSIQEHLKDKNLYLDSGFMVKLAGKRAFFTGAYIPDKDTFDESTRFIDYGDIQNKIMNNEEIAIVIVTDFTELMVDSPPLKNDLIENPRKDSKVERNVIWNLKETEKLNINIRNIETDGLHHFMLKVGLFYNDRVLDLVYETKVFHKETRQFDEVVSFDIPLSNLPVNTKICIVLYGSKIKLSDPRIKYMIPEAWINLALFDHNYSLTESIKTAKMFTYPITSLVQGLNPLGTCIPLMDDNCAYLIEYNFILGGKEVFYPQDRQIKNTLYKNDAIMNVKKQKELSDNNFFREMMQLINFSDLNHAQKKKLWKERVLCFKKFPNLMPKILESMPDFTKKSICKAFMLLDKAPPILPEQSLELLQLKYCHPLFRSYLIRNLKQFR